VALYHVNITAKDKHNMLCELSCSKHTSSNTSRRYRYILVLLDTARYCAALVIDSKHIQQYVSCCSDDDTCMLCGTMLPTPCDALECQAD
jgi:hypothetical protein